MPEYKFADIAYNSTQKKKPTEEDKERYIGLEHLDSGSLVVTRWGAEVAPIGEKLLMKKGDVLFGKRRAYQKKVAIAPFDGIFSAHGMVLRPNEEVVTKEYFPLFISSDYFLDEAIRISVGSLSPTVNWKDLKELRFRLPTIEEQKRITPVIWAAITAKNRYLSLLNATDALVKSQFIEMFGDPDTSQQFERIPIGELAMVTSGGTPNRKIEKYWKNGNIPWVKTTELKNSKISDTEEHITEEGMRESSAKYVPANTVLIAMYGQGKTRGMTALLEKEATTNQACACILPSKKIEPKYLWKFMIHSYEKLRSLAEGAGQPNLNAKMIKEFMIIVPPREMQIEYIRFSEQADKSKFELKQAIEKVDNLIKSLIQ